MTREDDSIGPSNRIGQGSGCNVAEREIGLALRLRILAPAGKDRHHKSAAAALADRQAVAAPHAVERVAVTLLSSRKFTTARDRLRCLRPAARTGRRQTVKQGGLQ